MHNYVNKYVRVSDVIACNVCPRKAFYRLKRRNGDAVAYGDMRKEMFLTVSSSLPHIAKEETPLTALYDTIRRASEDASHIYGAGSVETIRRVKDEMVLMAPDIVKGLEGNAWRTVYAERVAVYSDRLRMSGVVDRVYEHGGQKAPVYVSGSLPPKDGVYHSDRLRVAAYAMLLEERYRTNITSGFVEYFPGWCMREVAVRKKDRWAVLSLRDRINEMKEGRMPDARRGERCERCEYRQDCGVRVSFLDRLLG